MRIRASGAWRGEGLKALGDKLRSELVCVPGGDLGGLGKSFVWSAAACKS